ncbi:hypothetical protein [Methanosarcina sp. WWM596]|uniref:hypothetical protein n=1 Tax=Methanosarcina sp. WWM596 TaxID=1434103 RepID=UPI0018CD6DAE|nr:hypothetical protein [Methanosarcina sp. WWM596]
MKLQPDYPIFRNEPLVFAGFAFKEPLCPSQQVKCVPIPVKRHEFVRDSFEERNFEFVFFSRRYRKPPYLLVIIRELPALLSDESEDGASFE